MQPDGTNIVMPFYATGREWYDAIRAADNDEAGLILKLQAWCASHAGSGGFIPDCLEWDKKTWLKIAGIERKILKKYLGKSRFFIPENGGVRLLIHDAQREAQALETSAKQAERARSKWAKIKHAAGDAAGDAAAMQKSRIPEFQNLNYNPPSSPEGGYKAGAPADDAGGWMDGVGVGANDGAMNAQALPAPACTQPPAPDDDDDDCLDTPDALALLNSAISPQRAASPRRNRPENLQQVQEVFATYMTGTPAAKVKKCAQAFFNSNEKAGWVDEQGAPLMNWMNRARGYAETCANNIKAAKETACRTPSRSGKLNRNIY